MVARSEAHHPLPAHQGSGVKSIPFAISTRHRLSTGMLPLPRRLGTLLALPLAALLLRMPPARLLPNLGDPQVLQAVGMSLSSTLVTTLVTICFGTPVGYLLVRRSFPLRRVIDTLVDLPTVLPPAVAGVALLLAFGRQGMLGGVLQWLHIWPSILVSS